MDVEMVPHERLEAGRRFARVAATAGGRRWLRLNGYRGGERVFPADSEEAVVDVIDRIEAHGGSPAFLAVHFAGRPDSESTVLVRWDGIDYGDERPGALRLLNAAAGQGSSIGMVVDAVIDRDRPEPQRSEALGDLVSQFRLFASQ